MGPALSLPKVTSLYRRVQAPAPCPSGVPEGEAVCMEHFSVRGPGPGLPLCPITELPAL